MQYYKPHWREYPFFQVEYPPLKTNPKQWIPEPLGAHFWLSILVQCASFEANPIALVWVCTCAGLSRSTQRSPFPFCRQSEFLMFVQQ